MSEPTTKRPEGEVSVAIRRMDGRIMDLGDRVEELSNILSPITLQPNVKDTAPDTARDTCTACDLANEIHSMADRMESLVNAICSLRDRVDL